MCPVFIKQKGEKLGTLNTVVIFLLFISFYSKNLSINGFSNKIHFFKFWELFSAKNLTVKSALFEIHIAKKLFGRES